LLGVPGIEDAIPGHDPRLGVPVIHVAVPGHGWLPRSLPPPATHIHAWRSLPSRLFACKPESASNSAANQAQDPMSAVTVSNSTGKKAEKPRTART
jgi:hypothetical protein